MGTGFDALCVNDPDLAAVRAAVRAFLAADAAQFGWRPAVDCWLSGWDTGFSARLADAGFLGLTIPTEYGGRSLGNHSGHLHRYVVTEELLAHGAPVAAHWIADRQVAPGLLAYGSDEQRRRILPRIAAGRFSSAIGMSEPQAGSDLSAAAARATRVNGGWLLTGHKVWTSGAHLAHQVVVLARTSPADPEHRHAGFSQFLVATDAPGVRIEAIVGMDGAHHFNELVFSDVFVADADVLGEVGNGWHQVTAELSFERSGPERILSTAPLILALLRELPDSVGHHRATGDLVARLISLRQLSVSVARSLAGGAQPVSQAALVKDLGTRFEQDSVELAADLLDSTVDPSGDLHGLLTAARLHAPLFTLRGGTNEVLRGVVAKGMARTGGVSLTADDEFAELRSLVDDVARRSFDARLGQRGVAEVFDDALWRRLADTGLARLTSSGDAGPWEAAVVLRGLAFHAAAVPIAETDLLAGWLAARADIAIPGDEPLTVVIADAVVAGGRVRGTATGVPWLGAASSVLLAAITDDALLVTRLEPGSLDATPGHNLAGEPRDTVVFDLPTDGLRALDRTVADELARRGAWARCVQIIGALDAAADSSVAHTRQRVQFGRPLNAFQAVQHALAGMAGEIERARAVVNLAVAGAVDQGFDSPQADYAVAVAKVVLGRVVPEVTRIAHQLHGAIGTTLEHPLRLATLRAHSWIDEFGNTGTYARRLGRLTLGSADPWDVVIGTPSGRL